MICPDVQSGPGQVNAQVCRELEYQMFVRHVHRISCHIHFPVAGKYQSAMVEMSSVFSAKLHQNLHGFHLGKKPATHEIDLDALRAE